MLRDPGNTYGTRAPVHIIPGKERRLLQAVHVLIKCSSGMEPQFLRLIQKGAQLVAGAEFLRQRSEAGPVHLIGWARGQPIPVNRESACRGLHLARYEKGAVLALTLPFGVEAMDTIWGQTCQECGAHRRAQIAITDANMVRISPGPETIGSSVKPSIG